MLAGDAHGLNSLEYQPAKIAAVEGHWEKSDETGVPLILFGWPDMAAETTRFAVAVPHLGSLILTHQWNGKVPGLKEFAAEDRPNSTVVFWTFRIMVGLGVLMAVLGLWSLWLRWRGRLYSSRGFLWLALAMGPSGLVALLAGWMTTEVGRQPWVVYGLMRTKDAASNHPALALTVTLTVFVLVYFAVFGTGVVYLLKLVAKGPDGGELPEPPVLHQRPMRPLSAVSEPIDQPHADKTR
jgi:cytochrome d ubiquinol oxidase subunit I